MKKILAVSLCAIMAVGAARADIASVEYVDEQITDASSTYRNEIREYSKKHGTLKTLMKLLNEGEIPAKDVTIWGSEVDKQNKRKKREPER